MTSERRWRSLLITTNPDRKPKMSRPSVAPSQRNLTLTEELEKLEQSITLTLQGVFSAN